MNNVYDWTIEQETCFDNVSSEDWRVLSSGALLFLNHLEDGHEETVKVFAPSRWISFYPSEDE